MRREVTELSTQSVTIHQSKAASPADLEPIREVIRPTSTPKAIAKVLPRPPVKAASSAAEASKSAPPARAPPVLAYERSQGRAGDKIEELRSYRNFNGLLPGSGVERKFILFLDYHQVLDRGAAESASWSRKIPRDNVAFLRRAKESAERVWGNKHSLLIFVREIIEEGVTREREGVTGPLATASQISRGFSIPRCIVDDNVRVIAEFVRAQDQENPAHIKLRRKPSAERAEVVRPFLASCSEDLEALFRH